MNEQLTRLAALVRERRALPTPDELREIREEAGVTREELAQAIGVTPQAIANWEAGRRPRRDLIPAYLAALNVLREAST